MYHSLEDQNVGTAPISSMRMFHALQGLGKPAALYMYPYEDHSVATYADGSRSVGAVVRVVRCVREESES